MGDEEMVAENEENPETPKSLNTSKQGVFSEQCSPAMIRIVSKNLDQNFNEEKDQLVSSDNEEILFDNGRGFLCSEAESG